MREAFIGVDFGGTRIKVGVVSDGDMLEDLNIEAFAAQNFEVRLHTIAEQISGLLARRDYQLTGMGFAFPGIVNFYQGTILSKYVKYPGAENTNLCDWAEKHFGVPAVVENDARAALVGEWKHGAGAGSTDLVLVTLGTGVGTGVLVHGAPLRGKNFIGGNLGGHTTINADGQVCNCGNIGCVESEASTWALRQIAEDSPDFRTSRLADLEVIDFKELFQLADEGDVLAIRLRDRCLKVWALGVINLIHAYDPEKVILGGGIMNSGHVIIPYIRQMIDQHSWITSTDVELVAAARPEHAGILGVYELFKQTKNR